MRLPRGRGVRLALFACAVGLGGFLAATALGNHDPVHPFAGSWNTSYAQAPTSGTISFRFVGDEEGKAALAAIPDALLPCEEPSDYYVGTYTRGGDTGTHAGCTAGNLLRSSFHSDSVAVGVTGLSCSSSAGTCGWFNATFTSAASWSGSFNVVGGYLEQWGGAFASHFDGDGAADTATTSTEGASTEEEPPPKCAGKEATIYPDEDDPFGVPLFGTPGPDVIVGSQAGELIAGGGGNDLICGRGGDDIINGGGGDDSLSGNGGGDSLNGGSGSDDLLGGTGNDRLKGGTGDDVLFGEQGSDTLRYTPADLEVDGGPGIDTCINSIAGLRGQNARRCER